MRDELWHAAWRLLDQADLSGRWRRQDDKIEAVLRFLLEPDPSPRHVPRIRLLTCLPLEPSSTSESGPEPKPAALIEIATGDKPCARLSSTCCVPPILTELTQALQRSFRGTWEHGVPEIADYALWDDNGEPRPLLRTPHPSRPHALPHETTQHSGCSSDWTR